MQVTNIGLQAGTLIAFKHLANEALIGLEQHHMHESVHAAALFTMKVAKSDVSEPR